MSEEEQDKKVFRVVDKRRFTAEGETRPDAPADRAEAPAPAAPPRQPKPPANAQNGANHAANRSDPRAADQAPRETDPSSRTASGLDFIQFIASLATQALASLGALPEARAQGIPVSIEAAREYIEVIVLLQEKTRGNLSREEDAAMQRIVSELKMAYVEVTQRPAKGPQPPR